MGVHGEGSGRVAVIGAGTTGPSWAGLFAAHGHEVRLYARRAEARAAAVGVAERAARFLGSRGLADRRCVESGAALLRASGDLAEAVDGAVLVQECVTDDISVKQEVFAEASRCAPQDAIIATSSSGLSITEIQRDALLPGRCLAAHPYNPPHLIPLVELAAGRHTDAATMERAVTLYRSVGKEPVVLDADVPGYIANRLSAALWREAIELVRSGVASVEEVDVAVSRGPGLRWAVMGPHLIYHLSGGPGGITGHMAHLSRSKEAMLRDLASWTAFPPGTAELLGSGLEAEVDGRTTEELEAERDEALAAILVALHRSRSMRARGSCHR